MSVAKRGWRSPFWGIWTCIFELSWLFCLSVSFPAPIWLQGLIQIPPTQITLVNFLSRLNLRVCWVLKLSAHRPQRRSAMFVKFKSWILLNLILLCGDVIINPGPNWKCPCGLCQNHNKHKPHQKYKTRTPSKSTWNCLKIAQILFSTTSSKVTGSAGHSSFL